MNCSDDKTWPFVFYDDEPCIIEISRLDRFAKIAFKNRWSAPRKAYYHYNRCFTIVTVIVKPWLFFYHGHGLEL